MVPQAVTVHKYGMMPDVDSTEPENAAQHMYTQLYAASYMYMELYILYDMPYCCRLVSHWICLTNTYFASLPTVYCSVVPVNIPS